jgi:hypothetical protein
MCQGAKRTSRAGSPLSKNYIGAELHEIKSLQKIKKIDEILSCRRVRSLVQKSIPGDTEGPVVGSYLNRILLNAQFCPLTGYQPTETFFLKLLNNDAGHL